MSILLLFLIAVLAFAAYRVGAGMHTRDLFYRKFGRMICSYLGHSRSTRHVQRAGDVYSSRCSRCQIRMHKIGKQGEWQVVNPANAAVAAAALQASELGTSAVRPSEAEEEMPDPAFAEPAIETPAAGTPRRLRRRTGGASA